MKQRPAEKAPESDQHADDAEVRRSKNLCERQKMEAHDYRIPVGREVGAMEPIREDRSEKEREDLGKHDE